MPWPYFFIIYNSLENKDKPKFVSHKYDITIFKNIDNILTLDNHDITKMMDMLYNIRYYFLRNNSVIYSVYFI